MHNNHEPDMTTKSSFKLPEIGWIPEDWEVKKFEDLFFIKAGGDFNPKYAAKEKDKLFKYPIYGNGIENKGLLGYSFIADSNSGSITVTARGNLGVATYRDTSFLAVGRLIVLKPKINLNGIYYSEFINCFIRFSAETTGVPQLTAPQIAKYKLPLPPLPEQHAIATVLSDVDKLIESLDELIEKKQAIKKATMHLLLTGKKRLPGFDTNNKFKKTEIGCIPEDWEVNKLGLICNFYDNLRIPVEESKRESGSIPYYGANGILSYVNGYTHDGEFVLFAEDGASDLKDYPIFYTKGKIWVNNHAHVISGVKNKTDTRYVYYALKQANFTNLLVGGTRAKLNGSLAREIKIFMPNSIQEQHAIAQVLSDMDSEIEALQAKRDKLKQLKLGMMQVLLTGKIRLVETSKEAEV